MRAEKENMDRNKEYEDQVSFWSKRAEDQSKQYELLLQKLNDVANDAKESRNLAEAERERAEQLKTLLQQNLNPKRHEHVESTGDIVVSSIIQQTYQLFLKLWLIFEKNTKILLQSPAKKHRSSNIRKKAPKLSRNQSITKKEGNQLEKEAGYDSLEKLHQKAQELLNIASVTSSSSDTSSVNNLNPIQRKEMSTDDISNRLDKTSKVTSSSIDNKLRVSENKPKKVLDSICNKTSNSLIQNGPTYKGKSKTKQTIKTLQRNGPNALPGRFVFIYT